MIVYNVTIKVNPEIHIDWLSWMKNSHIPDVMNVRIFLENQVCKILNQDDSEGVTYAIQYKCPTLDEFDNYMLNFAPRLQAEHNTKFKGKFVAFRTLMQIV